MTMASVFTHPFSTHSDIWELLNGPCTSPDCSFCHLYSHITSLLRSAVGVVVGVVDPETELDLSPTSANMSTGSEHKYM